MKTTLLAASLCLLTPLAIGQRQALFVTSATPTTSDVQISNRLVLLGFTVTRITDSASQTSDANGKDLVVISASVGSGSVSTKFTTVAVPVIDWEWAVYDELGLDSNNAGGVNLTSQTQIRITDPNHPLAGGLPAGLVTVLSAAGDVASLAVPYPGAKVVATAASSGSAVLFAYEKGDPLHPARITNAPARRVGFFIANDTFRNATEDAMTLFDAAVSWASRSARILFIADLILGDGTVNQANDREVVSRLRNQGHVVTLADDQDANLGALFDNKDLIIISSSVGSGNQPLNMLAVSDLRTRNVPILDCEPGLYDELLLQTSTAFLNPGSQTTLNITAAGQSHPLGAANCAGSVRVATGTATFSMGSLPATYGAEAVLMAEAADAPNPGAPAIFAYEAGAHLADNTTVTPARRLAFFFNASTAVGGYNAAGQALLDAAVNWALSAPDTRTPVNLLNRVADVTTNESAPVRFTVKVVGGSPRLIQWYRNGTEIGGANCATYSIPAVSTADNGATFFAVVSNSFSAVTSRVATLTVIVDTNPPTMVSAFGAGLPPTLFDLVYSEPVEANSAVDTFNYCLGNGSGVLTATLDADGKTVHFTCGPITNGTILSLTGGAVTDRAFTPNALNPGDPGSSVAIVTTDGSLRRHRYNNIGGVLVSDLTTHPNFPSQPDVVDFPTSLEDPSPSEDTAANNNFGVHLHGYLTPPVSGSYNFFISADDQGLLYLSTDADPAHKRLIAAEPQWNNPREWVAPNSLARRQASTAGVPNFFPMANPNMPQNRSEFMVGPISLMAGQRYYVEAFMKEGGGGNTLGVTWQRPGEPTPANGAAPIPGLYLSRYNVPASIPPDQPTDLTTLDFRQATFTISPGGSPQLLIQWYENDAPIPGANARSFTTPLLATTDNGKTYFAVVMNDFSAATSRVATLTVNADMVPPVLVSAAALNSTSVGLCFDEALDAATAQNPANYTVNGGAVNVTSAALRYDLNTVALTLGGPVVSGFTVSVNNVTDLSTRNAIAPNSSATGNVAGWIPVDIGTPGDPAAAGSSFTCRNVEFELIAGGSDVWGTADHGQFAYQQITGNFDKSVKISRIDGTDPSAKGGLMARESLDAASRNLHAIVMPPLVNPSGVIGRNIYETGTRTTTGGTTTGWGIAGGANGNLPANHPNSWIRFRRVGTIWKAYVSSNGLDWVQNGQSEQLYPASVFFLLEATAHNNDGRTNRVLFQNLADTVIPGASVAITQQPQNTSIDANHTASFSATAAASGVATSEIGYQWQKSDGAGGYTNINAIGANAASLSVLATLADDGAQYRVVASVPGASAISSAAILTVTNDITPPQVVSASRGLAPSTVTVVFDEFLDIGSAQDTFNYSIAGTGGGIGVFPAVLGSDGRTVRLTTGAPLADNGFYLLTINDVKDLAGNGTVNAQVLIRILIGPVQAVGGQVVIEAENFDTNTPASNGKMWQFLTTLGGNGTFSGAGYMQALPESGGVVDNPTAFLAPGASPRLDYRVNLPAPGTWRAWLRGNDFVGAANSCHIGVDGTAPNPNNFRIGNTGGATGWGDGNWKWTRDANDSTTTFADIRITTPGLHTFNVWMREDSVIVDKILLTTDTANILPVNTVIGPDETPRGDLTPPALVNIAFAGGNVTISWNVPAGISRLQQADQVRGPWSDVQGADPNGTVIAANAMQKFYRVAIP